ncbi:hypothetical protein L1987_30918 [Smallanthus sonchifolius]|uniref:Uncharacterized protein n=1 Tax=Smallanthus sonchifolius TaxID=185202 RepID=A0ACB9I5Y4_9ASTR|nr:hypothetical protein L1987_30918 [Smallanthus sonchifolius]
MSPQPNPTQPNPSFQSIHPHIKINSNQTLPFCSLHFILTMSQPKKHTVAHTCNQLSLFLKQKGCLRDLHLGINPKSDDTVRMTVDLLSNMENPDQNNPQTDKLLKPEDSGNKNRSAAQMTIFYDGQVIVLDDIPADRARDVMLAAGDIKPSPTSGNTETRPSESNHVRVEANGLDLPIARRASLHKFLAKRKDRAAVRAPYPLPGDGGFKPERNFDLNL